MFIFDKHKLSFYLSRALWLRKYDGFDFLREHTIEVSRSFLRWAPSSWFSTLASFGDCGLVNVEIKRFDLTRDHVIDVSRNFEGEVLSWEVTIQLSLGSIGLVKVEI